MRIGRELILKLFDATSMQRWNDKIRPVELRELDKQAHKMIIAYLLGKFEEKEKNFNWVEIIEGGLFEFLQRLIVTDLQPQVLDRIIRDKPKYRQLNERVYHELEPTINPLGKEFCERFKNYLEHLPKGRLTLNRKILNAAHFYATKWEFDIIERANPNGYEIDRIRKLINKELEKYYTLKGIKEITLKQNLRTFVDLCGLLRFQVRWSRLYMAPRTSVLGHMLIVAVLSYLFSLKMKAYERRRVNNYFTGLFHDFPEALTRDIPSPVKHFDEEINNLIQDYEKERMKKEVYGLIPPKWHQQVRMFTEKEFSNIVEINGKVKNKTCDDINRSFNKDEYDPRDGELIKAVDDLSGFVEAYMSLRNGVKSEDLRNAANDKKTQYERKSIGGIDFSQIYESFPLDT